MTRRNTLTVIQMNDSHAYFHLHQEWFWQGNQLVYRPAGGYARIATMVQGIRRSVGDGVLFLDNGDTFHGTYAAVQTKGKAMVPVLNALSIDAMTGHWDFGYGPEVFKQRASELNYPVLAINVYEEETENRLFPPYAVREVNGLRVGLMGIASNIVDKTMPPHFSTGVRFTMGREELPGVIDILRNQEQVDLVILISHLGFPQEMKLLSEVPGVDLCLSGHTHNRISPPVKQGDTLVMQSGCHGSFLGRMDLEVTDGRISGFTHHLLEVDADILPDPTVAAIIDRELDPFMDDLNTVVGEVATALNRAATLETTMDNFLLSAVLAETGATMAFSNGWRYGAPVVPGPVTLNDLYNIIPMNPPIGMVDLSGEELVEMLEENLEKTFSGDAYQQMGGFVKRGLGLTVYFKIENPAGSRIQQIFVGEEPLDRSRIYHTAFVTAQGVPKKYGTNRRELATHAVEAMRRYLSEQKPAYAELRGTYTAV